MTQNPPVIHTAESAVAVMHETSKWYGDVIGLNQVSLEICPGITGLLGPNGAGKSTLLKLLTGQLKPSRGTIRIFGLDPWTDRNVFRLIGYCPDSEQLYDDMNGLEFVELMGRLADYSKTESTQRAKVQLERVSMSQHSNKLIRGYSKGMRQRVRLAAALIHDPRLVILDEPLNGLDPMGRIEMIELFRSLADEGRSIVVSSHILHEIENLTRHMIMLHRGRILASGQIDEVRALIEKQPLTLRIKTSDPRTVASHIIGLNSVTSMEFPDKTPPRGTRAVTPAPVLSDTLTVRVTQPDEVFEKLQLAAIEDNLAIDSIEALDDNLDAIFRYLVDQT